MKYFFTLTTILLLASFLYSMDFTEIIIKENKEAAEILDQLDEDDIADILINISDEKSYPYIIDRLLQDVQKEYSRL